MLPPGHDENLHLTNHTYKIKMQKQLFSLFRIQLKFSMHIA